MSGSLHSEQSGCHRAQELDVYGLSEVTQLRRRPTAAVKTGWAWIPVEAIARFVTEETLWAPINLPGNGTLTWPPFLQVYHTQGTPKRPLSGFAYAFLTGPEMLGGSLSSCREGN